MKKGTNSSCLNCISGRDGVFCDLNREALEEIAHLKINNIYKRGQTLFVQNNHPIGIYCIGSGNIKLTKMGQDGKETIVRIIKGGDILGHRSLFTGDNYSATATAMEDTNVCFIDKKFILRLIEKNPAVASRIIYKLSRDMGIAEKKLSLLHQKNVRERLAELIISLMVTHGLKEGGRWKIDLKLTREEMSAMIGTAYETLSSFMNEFKDAGIIEQEGKTIFIKDEEELSNWANIKCPMKLPVLSTSTEELTK